ncbi:PHP domain-containing protein [Salinispira pacifica]
MVLRVDLHLHSCLSPCGDLEMSPRLIARTARQRGLDAIALCDHNSALNCPAFAAACAEEGILAVHGLEVTTREELHVLSLFSDAVSAVEFGELVYGRILSGPFDAERYGDQVYVDEQENIIGSVEKLLIGAVDLSLEEVEAEVHAEGGLVVPAHIDRSNYSVISQLGFLPHGNYDAVEIYRPQGAGSARGYPVIVSSDAHFAVDIGARHTVIEAGECSFAGIAAAFEAGAVTPLFARPEPRPGNEPHRQTGPYR